MQTRISRSVDLVYTGLSIVVPAPTFLLPLTLQRPELARHHESGKKVQRGLFGVQQQYGHGQVGDTMRRLGEQVGGLVRSVVGARQLMAVGWLALVESLAGWHWVVVRLIRGQKLDYRGFWFVVRRACWWGVGERVCWRRGTV